LFSLNRVGHGDEHTGRRAEGDSRRSAGSVLRSQEGSGEEWLSRCARGNVVIAFNARCGPIPLRLAYFGAPRDWSCAR
jgi:hypothetical protein